ncbi:MAG: cobalt ECF transporter T component CbiQ [Chloroflexi bacterium]|nr:cobalt ECF transporter T component CbiQ [Chloroflexota bacterium]
MRELYVNNFSLIHQLDARVKIIFTLAFIVFLNLTPLKAWPAYILFLTLSLSVTLFSRLGIGLVLRRAFLALPFVLAALPLIFIGSPPYVAVPFFPEIPVYFSLEGLGRFTSIALRSWISVQAAILLTATTRFPDLLIALRQLKIPKLFVAIIGLMWRYLFVIGEEVIRMMRARASRSATVLGSHQAHGALYWRARVTGSMAGNLFLRSLERSDRVYAAMLSRGYTGDLPICEAQPLSRKEKLVLLLGIFLLVLLWVLGVLTGG